MRDADSNRVGSANQFIEAPNLKKGQLALSGVVVAGASADEVSFNPDIEARANPAVRQMRPGMVLNYAYSIYNAKREKKSKRPQLQTQVRMFHGSELIYSGKVLDLNVVEQNGLKPIPAIGTVQLGSKLQSGDYFLQVVVTDLLADKNRNTSVSGIDFEVVD